MNAKLQYQLAVEDLHRLLALVRAGSLQGAAERLGVDGSTVFRALQKMEAGLGRRLFERSRAGYTPTELALELAERAEKIESELQRAREAAQQQSAEIAGTVRLTTTDTLLHALVAPQLPALCQSHPLLQFEFNTSSQLSSLTRRDADIALRATRTPPPHLVGKHIGPIRMALFAGAGAPEPAPADLDHLPWVAPDEALPEHPSVLWRKKHHPRARTTCRVDSILSVAELIGLGLGIGVLPLFLAEGRGELRQISAALPECETQLWLLTHTESRHLRRVSAVYSHLVEKLELR